MQSQNASRILPKRLIIGLAILISYLVPTAVSVAQDALWRSYYTSAQREYQHGNFTEARNLLDSALKAAIRPDESLSTYYYLAHVCVKNQQLIDAEAYYRFVLDGLGTKTWAVLRPPDGTPEWEQSASNVEQATNGKQFLSILDKRPPQLIAVKLAKPITIIDVLTDYGNMLQSLNRYSEAEGAYRQALILSECRPDQAISYEAKILQRLEVLYQLEGRKEEQDSVGRQLTVARNTSVPNFDVLVGQTVKALDRFGHNPHSLAIRLNNLALFCATHGDYARSQTLFERALSSLNEHPRRYKQDRRVILSNYSDLLLAMGRVAEANNVHREALAISSSSDVPESADTALSAR